MTKVADRVLRAPADPYDLIRQMRGDTSKYHEVILDGSQYTIGKAEGDGLESFVNSDALPIEMECREDPRFKADAIQRALEACGVVFLDEIPWEPRTIFRFAILPDGWKRIPTDQGIWSEDMWSDIVDDKGRRRGQVFYKATPFAPQATFYFELLFTISTDDSQLDKTGDCVGIVKKGGEIIHTTEAFNTSDDPARRLARKEAGWPEDYARLDACQLARDVAKNWLDANYPGWETQSKYWD